MRAAIGLVLLASVCMPVPASAEDTEKVLRTVQAVSPVDPSPTEGARLLAAALREGSRHSLQAEGSEPIEPRTFRTPPTARPFQQPSTRSWISRHPALFGTLVGAAAGAVAAGTMENELFCSRGDEDCFFHGGSRVLVGAGFGAGIGALIG